MDAGFFDISDGFADLILEFVFDGSRADESEINFDLFGDIINSFFFIIGLKHSFLELFIPDIVE